MQRRVYIVLLLLVIPMMFVSASGDAENEQIIIHQENGILVSNGTLILTGTSNIPLNNATWNLFNFSDDNQNLAVISSGDYLTEVDPIEDNLWTWQLQVNVSEIDCTCFLSVGVYDTYSTIYVYIGEDNHRPIILNIENQPQIITNDDMEFSLDLILPTSHDGPLFAQTNICNSAANFLTCLSDPITANTAVNQDGDNYKLILNLSTNNVYEGNWIVSTRIIDNLLTQSNPISTGFNFDITPPSVNISMRGSIIEGERVDIYANAEDNQDSGEISYTWLYSQPGEEFRGLSTQEDSSSISLYPELSGNWSVRVEIRDGAGWTNSSQINFSVNNYLPVAKLTIDSMIIENGSSIKVNPDSSWVISANECFDTSNDLDDLTYYWRFTSEQGTEIFTGVEISSELELASEIYDVQFIVYDDDSSSSTIEFEIDFTEQMPLNSVPIMIKLIVIFILSAGAIVLLKYSNREIKDESNKIPKWKPKK